MTKLTLIITLALLCGVGNAQVVSDTPTNSVQASVTLLMNKTQYCVGESPRYVVTTTEALVGKPIIWSSTFKPVGSKTTQIYNEGPFGVITNTGQMGIWTAVGGTWTLAQAGDWTKIANVAGAVASFRFSVVLCDYRSAFVPQYTRMNPNPGTVLAYRLGTNSTADLSVIFDGMDDASRIQGWRVIVDNSDMTQFVQNLPGFSFEQVFAIAPPETNNQTPQQYYPDGMAIRIPYPLSTLSPGQHYFDIKVVLIDGTVLETSSYYEVREVFETPATPIVELPPTQLDVNCPGIAIVGQGINFNANGGNGTYFWTANEGKPSFGAGPNFYTTFSSVAPGVRVLVNSGNQTVFCPLNVVPAPPTPQPNP